MCDVVFALGENDSYYLECPSRWCSNALPSAIVSLFTNDEVTTSSHMSLGNDGSYIFTYQRKSNHNGGWRCASYGIPTALNTWLYEKDAEGDCVRHFDKLKVSLGPGDDSFFASDGSSYKWSNLPEPLQKALDANLENGTWKDSPRIVSLGFDGDYVMVTANNAAAWRLNHFKPLDTLFETMKENGTTSLSHNITLSPHHAGRCVIHLTTGFAGSEEMPLTSTTHLDNMKKAILSDSEKVKHEAKVADMERTEREIELLDMAAQQADRQTARNMRTIDFFSQIDTVCKVCKEHPHYCTCDTGLF